MTLAPFTSRQRRGGGQLAVAPAYRWDPFREMEDINSRFGQLVRSFFGDTGGFSGAGASSPLAPPVDIEETDDAYIVEVDLPNVNPDDVTVEMRGEELRISGGFQQHERSGIMRRQNRPVGDFEYVVDLPSDIDAGRVEATYDGGVLKVTVGKTREAQPRRIEVRASNGEQRIDQGDGQQATQSERR
jgi:HSP20 family protein